MSYKTKIIPCEFCELVKAILEEDGELSKTDERLYEAHLRKHHGMIR